MAKNDDSFAKSRRSTATKNDCATRTPDLQPIITEFMAERKKFQAKMAKIKADSMENLEKIYGSIGSASNITTDPYDSGSPDDFVVADDGSTAEISFILVEQGAVDFGVCYTKLVETEALKQQTVDKMLDMRFNLHGYQIPVDGCVFLEMILHDLNPVFPLWLYSFEIASENPESGKSPLLRLEWCRTKDCVSPTFLGAGIEHLFGGSVAQSEHADHVDVQRPEGCIHNTGYGCETCTSEDKPISECNAWGYCQERPATTRPSSSLVMPIQASCVKGGIFASTIITDHEQTMGKLVCEQKKCFYIVPRSQYPEKVPGNALGNPEPGSRLELCTKQGFGEKMQPASVLNPGEQYLVNQMCDTRNEACIIGLARTASMDNTEEWKWDDGSCLEWTNWAAFPKQIPGNCWFGHDPSKCLRDGVPDPTCCVPQSSAAGCADGYHYTPGNYGCKIEDEIRFDIVCCFPGGGVFPYPGTDAAQIYEGMWYSTAASSGPMQGFNISILCSIDQDDVDWQNLPKGITADRRLTHMTMGPSQEDGRNVAEQESREEITGHDNIRDPNQHHINKTRTESSPAVPVDTNVDINKTRTELPSSPAVPVDTNVDFPVRRRALSGASPTSTTEVGPLKSVVTKLPRQGRIYSPQYTSRVFHAAELQNLIYTKSKLLNRLAGGTFAITKNDENTKSKTDLDVTQFPQAVVSIVPPLLLQARSPVVDCNDQAPTLGKALSKYFWTQHLETKCEATYQCRIANQLISSTSAGTSAERRSGFGCVDRDPEKYLKKEFYFDRQSREFTNENGREMYVYPEFLDTLTLQKIYRDGHVQDTGMWVDLQTTEVILLNVFLSPTKRTGTVLQVQFAYGGRDGGESGEKIEVVISMSSFVQMSQDDQDYWMIFIRLVMISCVVDLLLLAYGVYQQWKERNAWLERIQIPSLDGTGLKEILRPKSGVDVHNKDSSCERASSTKCSWNSTVVIAGQVERIQLPGRALIGVKKRIKKILNVVTVWDWFDLVHRAVTIVFVCVHYEHYRSDFAAGDGVGFFEQPIMDMLRIPWLSEDIEYEIVVAHSKIFHDVVRCFRRSACIPSLLSQRFHNDFI